MADSPTLLEQVQEIEQTLRYHSSLERTLCAKLREVVEALGDEVSHHPVTCAGKCCVALTPMKES